MVKMSVKMDEVSRLRNSPIIKKLLKAIKKGKRDHVNFMESQNIYERYAVMAFIQMKNIAVAFACYLKHFLQLNLPFCAAMN